MALLAIVGNSGLIEAAFTGFQVAESPEQPAKEQRLEGILRGGDRFFAKGIAIDIDGVTADGLAELGVR